MTHLTVREQMERVPMFVGTTWRFFHGKGFTWRGYFGVGPLRIAHQTWLWTGDVQRRLKEKRDPNWRSSP